jgi:DNA polymerase-3 subunit delta'
MLLGFESVKSSLSSLYQKNKLHHAILLYGAKGSGKASFAKEFVNEILENKNFHHPDILLIEKEAGKKEIGVEKIRTISTFLNQTSAISAHKFIIIDSACELTRSASNAILKILEEPRRNNFLILIAHSKSKILPTILSRCQIVKTPALSLENFSKILHKKNPNLRFEEIEFLSKICENSLAEIFEQSVDLAGIYQDFLKSIQQRKLEESLLKKIADKNFSYAIFEKILAFFFNRLLKFSGQVEQKLFFTEAEIFLALQEKNSHQKNFLIAEEALIMARQTQLLHLDKKLSSLNIFNKICHE